MSGFQLLQNYSPFGNLLVGLGGFLGLLGCGLMLVHRARLPHPWAVVVGTVLATLCFSLGCQTLGWLKIATSTTLTLWLAAWVSAGFVWMLRHIRSLPKLMSRLHPWQLLFLIPAALLLLMATSGSTKIDELYYHMLVPSRLVIDESLKFYQFPWQGAVPQMSFQIGLAPLHAIGFPNAGNVYSACFALLLSICAYSLIRQRNQSPFRASATAATLLIGMYPIVWYVTGGAHAFGDFAMSLAIVACTLQTSPPQHVRSWIWTGGLSILLVAAAASKVSLLPLAACLWTWHIFFQRPDSETTTRPSRRILAGAIPWLVFYAPSLLWTWSQSGSPFGPVLAGWFGDSAYDPERIANVLQSSREKARTFNNAVAISSMTGHSGAFWMLVACGCFLRHTSATLARFALLLQAVLIATVLPFDLRFLGGTHVALAILAGVNLRTPTFAQKISEGNRRLLILLLMAPWLGLQLYYQSPFLRYVTGQTTHEEFCRRYIAFYSDLLKVDRILPANASILVTGTRANSVYFPRRVFVRKNDVRGETPLFLFACNHGDSDLTDQIPSGYSVDEKIYENDHALLSASRIPGVPGKFGTVDVYRLLKPSRGR